MPGEHGHPAAEGPAQHQDQLAGKGEQGSCLGSWQALVNCSGGTLSLGLPLPRLSCPDPTCCGCSPTEEPLLWGQSCCCSRRPGFIQVLDPTLGVFQRFIFSTVCNSRSLAPAAEPSAGRGGGGGVPPGAGWTGGDAGENRARGSSWRPGDRRLLMGMEHFPSTLPGKG